MKTIKKQFNSVALILSILVLCQNCSVYERVPVSLEKSTQLDSKVEVEIINGDHIKFKRISFENENYYGIKDKHGKMEKILLEETNIEHIKVKDKTVSTIMNISLGLGLVFIAIVGIQAAAISGGW